MANKFDSQIFGFGIKLIARHLGQASIKDMRPSNVLQVNLVDGICAEFCVVHVNVYLRV